MNNYDFVIVGGGIIGLTVAKEIKRRQPVATIAILEKEERLGVHASGRNSGVLHCGIYYGADSLKAKVCANGARRLMAYADEYGINYRKDGKVIVAPEAKELSTVERLMKNAADNQIRAERIDNKQLHELEPSAPECAAAIYCPDTAVIDSPAVLVKLREQLIEQGVVFLLNTKVTGKKGDNALETNQGDIGFGYMINCAGAYADRIAALYGLAGEYILVPFKGLYWKLSEAGNPKIRANIYPVPDISMPFLGVHLTRVISGDVYVGPTAIPALGRENYGILKGAKLGEATNIGLKLAMMYLQNNNNFRKLAHVELLKYNKAFFLKAAQRLCPSLTSDELVPTHKVGIRPQLVNKKTNKIEMDYIFESTPNTLHVLNAISPAFTSSFAFADLIVDKANIR